MLSPEDMIMALPPTPAPAAGPAAGADPTMAGGAPPDDMGAAEGAEAPEMDCILTVCKDPNGGFMLYKGDEPEEGAEPAAPGAPPAEGEDQGQHFDSPQELMRGIMQLLNSDEGAESSFAKGFKGEDDPTAAKPDMPPAA